MDKITGTIKTLPYAISSRIPVSMNGEDRSIKNIGYAVGNYILEETSKHRSRPFKSTKFDFSVKKPLLSYLLPKNRQYVKVDVEAKSTDKTFKLSFRTAIQALEKHLENYDNERFGDSIKQVKPMRVLRRLVDNAIAISRTRI